jgi:hypothetical protein
VHKRNGNIKRPDRAVGIKVSKMSNSGGGMDGKEKVGTQ